MRLHLLGRNIVQQIEDYKRQQQQLHQQAAKRVRAGPRAASMQRANPGVRLVRIEAIGQLGEEEEEDNEDEEEEVRNEEYEAAGYSAREGGWTGQKAEEESSKLGPWEPVRVE